MHRIPLKQQYIEAVADLANVDKFYSLPVGYLEQWFKTNFEARLLQGDYTWYIEFETEQRQLEFILRYG